MDDLYHNKKGRINAATVLLMLILAGLGVIGGWWYGHQSSVHEKPARQFKLPEPGANPAPFAPSKGSALLEDKLADIAEAATPAVVNVFSEKVVATNPHSPFSNDPFFNFFFGPGLRGVPKERRERSLGSGVIVTPDGYILTNNHVVEGADSVLVATTDKKEYKAEIVGTDPQTDVAVLKIKGSKFPTLSLGDSDKIRVGQVVLAIGNPFGLSSTVTMGIISAEGRSQVGITDYEDFIQTDAAINPGNSGGALMNTSGELIGINTAIFSRSGGYQGIGFAIPINLARQVMESLINTGSVRRGWLGVSIQDLTPDLAEQFGLSETEGALVAEVMDGTPADKAGLKAGDVIVSINDEPVKDFTDLRNKIAAIEPGDTAHLELYRDGKKMDLDVKLGERPGKPEQVSAQERRSKKGPGQAEADGMKVSDLTAELADQLGIKPGDAVGVVVVDLDASSRAARAEIQVGDIITRMNRAPIENADDFRAAADRIGDNPFLVRLKRGDSSLFVVVPRK